ncbi:MAG TPA: hypothetical protein VHY84_20590 [Bryobacteraceae bacterium]|nr:hypothetical protein [Bryobacteraceae bacterium]
MKALLAVVVAVAVLICAQVVAAQAPLGGSDVMTYGKINGRAWRSMPDAAKITYVVGALEGAMSASPAEYAAKYMLGELKTGEVRDAIDRFFAEPENILINVIEALHIVAMRVMGASQQSIDTEVSVDRMVANGAPERKK